MSFTRPVVSFIAVLVLALATAALAQDVPVKVRDEDFAAYQKLRLEKAVNEHRAMFAHDAAAKAANKKKWDDALAAAKWDEEKYDGVSGAISDVQQALADEAKGGEEGDSAKETLKSADPVTVATVKAHQKELDEMRDLSQKAAQIVREEQQAELRGAPPEAKDLEGTWVYDLDASVELVAGKMDAETKAKLRESISKALSAATYTFGPGDAISTTSTTNGQENKATGTYRIEGSKLYIKGEGRKREQSVDCGIKDGQLRIGMMGVYSVFKKQ